MIAWVWTLFTIGAVSLIVLVGQHRWTLPPWLVPVLIFTGFGGILLGMGLFTLALIFG
ncbi:hypothetical protein [Roseospira navarrensis]|uniref:Uncharacterized protein n=1 Tax=Roseospira navarrensis TaxID=140058 RepID=A0A7X2D4I3_9PROT|nr:hypothetical protein [Roseospira navarrensis]MQX38454.1 hypothetical protein [Roseospira navarrensis]